MKKVLICVAFACASMVYAEAQSAQGNEVKKDCQAKKSCSSKATVKKQEVTGSRIPVQVDKDGRPIDSTLKVTVVGQDNISTWGIGSPAGALARIPYVSIRGGR